MASAIAKVDASVGWPACPACIHRHRPNTPCPPRGVWLVLTLCHRCDAPTGTYCTWHRDRHLTVVPTPDPAGLADENTPEDS